MTAISIGDADLRESEPSPAPPARPPSRTLVRRPTSGSGSTTRTTTSPATRNRTAAAATASPGPKPSSSTAPRAPGPITQAMFSTPVVSAFAVGRSASSTHCTPAAASEGIARGSGHGDGRDQGDDDGRRPAAPSSPPTSSPVSTARAKTDQRMHSGARVPVGERPGVRGEQQVRRVPEGDGDRGPDRRVGCGSGRTHRRRARPPAAPPSPIPWLISSATSARCLSTRPYAEVPTRATFLGAPVDSGDTRSRRSERILSVTTCQW